MSSKDRDLVELEHFQSNSIEFCNQLAQLGTKLLSCTEEASVSLQDSVSKVSLNRVNLLANQLITIGNHGSSEMTTARNKTRAELDQWNNM